MSQIGLTIKQVLERRKYLGGSDISVISGKNPFQDDFQLYEFKKGIYTPSEDSLSNKFTIAGNIFENIILELFQMRLQEDYKIEIAFTGMKNLVHPEYDFLVSHPDETLSNHDLLDCKTANSKTFIKKWGTEESPIIPTEYQYQGFWNAGIYYKVTGNLPKQFFFPVLQMSSKDYDIAAILAEKGELASFENLEEFYITDIELAKIKTSAMNAYNKAVQPLEDSEKDKIDYTAYFDSYKKRHIYLKLKKKFQIRQMNFDLRTFEALEINAINWWTKHIINGESPIITNKSIDYLKTKYQFGTPNKQIELGEDLDTQVANLKQAQARVRGIEYSISQTQESKDLADAQKYAQFQEVLLLNMIKDAEVATGKLAKVRAFNSETHSTNYELMKRNFPDIYEKLLKEKVITNDLSGRKLSMGNVVEVVEE